MFALNTTSAHLWVTKDWSALLARCFWDVHITVTSSRLVTEASHHPHLASIFFFSFPLFSAPFSSSLQSLPGFSAGSMALSSVYTFPTAFLCQLYDHLVAVEPRIGLFVTLSPLNHHNDCTTALVGSVACVQNPDEWAHGWNQWLYKILPSRSWMLCLRIFFFFYLAQILVVSVTCDIR